MQRKVFKLMATLGVAAAVFVSSASSAEAAFSLRLTADGGPTTTVTDADGDGIVSFTGLLGNFSVAVTTGTSEPFQFDPYLSLAYNVAVRAGVTGTHSFLIELSDSDYSSLSNSLTTVFNTASESGAVVYSAYWDAPSATFGTTNLIATGGSPLVGASAGPGGAGTLTMNVQITGAVARVANSGDAQIAAPEPATMGLFGLALFGLGGIARRRFAR